MTPLLQAWHDILRDKYDSMKGGEIEETIQGHGIYRGSIHRIDVVEGCLVFDTDALFVKRLNPSGVPLHDDWRPAIGLKRYSYHIAHADPTPPSAIPQWDAQGRLTFTSGNFISVIIYPSGHAELLGI